MKTWLAKFKISSALDDNNPGRKRLNGLEVASEEIRRFDHAARSLDRRLESGPPEQPLPPDLHASVMRAVRHAAGKSERQFAPVIVRWLPAPALALLVVAGVWWGLNRTAEQPQPLTTAGAALTRSHELTRQAPAAVLAPLSKEMESLHRDFRKAVEFLVASVP